MRDDEIEAALTATQTELANENEGPFSIGQNMWPGISKLIEECGEVLQVAGKLIATGGRCDHWSGVWLDQALEEELGDLLAAIEFVIRHNPLNDDVINARRDRKVELFNAWHLPARSPGTPLESVDSRCSDE